MTLALINFCSRSLCLVVFVFPRRHLFLFEHRGKPKLTDAPVLAGHPSWRRGRPASVACLVVADWLPAASNHARSKGALERTYDGKEPCSPWSSMAAKTGKSNVRD